MVILTAQDAQQIRLAKKNVNHETYKILFHMTIQRIRSRCEMNQTSLQYRIPNFLLGRPTINTKHAARYVAEKLKIYGYKSKFYSIRDQWYVEADWSIEPVKVRKKPRDVKREKVVDTSIQTNPGEAIRRMELIKMQLKNSMGRR
jgi:hypothetical protein